LFTDRHTQENILGRLLVNYTEMFRDPQFFNSIRHNVLPYLATYPKISIWHAGCSTGEEVYSLAILLDELKLLDRCKIYASDINETNLKTASEGVYSLQRIRESNYRYFRSGGNRHLSDYYTAYYDHVAFSNRIRERIEFISHDIVMDKPIGRFHLVLCRNVFIYFNYVLQNRAVKTIYDNLYNYGYFGIGQQEQFVNMENLELITVDAENKIFRKVI
jgi:chemotaxis protein methyltransferase CheR